MAGFAPAFKCHAGKNEAFTLWSQNAIALRDMVSKSTDSSRSSGTAFAAKIDQDKASRIKARSLRPLAKLWPFISRYPGQLIAFVIFLSLSALGSLSITWIAKIIVDCGFGANTESIKLCATIGSENSESLLPYFLFAAIFAVLFALAASLRFFFITRLGQRVICLLYTSPSPRDRQKSRMPSSA